MLDDDDDEVAVLMYGTYMYARHLDKYCNRGPYRFHL